MKSSKDDSDDDAEESGEDDDDSTGGEASMGGTDEEAEALLTEVKRQFNMVATSPEKPYKIKVLHNCSNKPGNFNILPKI